MSTINPYSAAPQAGNDAPKGSASNPYSQSEYQAILDNGTWSGGYVVGMGYVLPEVVINESSDKGSDSMSSDDSKDSDPYGSDDIFPDSGSSSSYGSTDTGENNNSGGNGNSNNSNGNEDQTINRGINNGRSFNINAAITYLLQNARSTSQRICAKRVREALEAGGLLTTGRPDWACQYATFLPTIGFSKIPYDNQYAPQKGDIAVMEQIINQPDPKDNHPYGHIAMYTGSIWVSDFIQSDMWGGPSYRKAKKCAIFRWK